MKAATPMHGMKWGQWGASCQGIERGCKGDGSGGTSVCEQVKVGGCVMPG